MPHAPKIQANKMLGIGTASPPVLSTTALLVTPTFQLLYLHSWKITMPMSVWAGPAVAKECHDRDGKEHFPVLLPCQHQVTLDSATEKHWAKSLQPTDGVGLITSCPVTGGY